MESSQSSRRVNDEAVAGDVARFLFLISTMNGRVESFMIFQRPVPHFGGTGSMYDQGRAVSTVRTPVVSDSAEAALRDSGTKPLT